MVENVIKLPVFFINIIFPQINACHEKLNYVNCKVGFNLAEITDRSYNNPGLKLSKHKDKTN